LFGKLLKQASKILELGSMKNDKSAISSGISDMLHRKSVIYLLVLF